jgi:hypothetical protein
MNTSIDLINIAPSQSFSEPPLAYKIESIKSMKEEKIRLTAPMFCKTAPHLERFPILNNT